MPAPQSIKDAMNALLDAAYDADGVAIARIEASGPFVRYDDSTGELPETVVYKVIVDASGPNEVRVRIAPRSTTMALWPF